MVLYEHYDYFGGERRERECYDTAAEVIRAAKKIMLLMMGASPITSSAASNGSTKSPANPNMGWFWAISPKRR